MSKVLNTLSAIGALVMAATPLIAIGGVAHAAETGVRPAHILVADLDLSRASDATTFRQRVDATAASFCMHRGDVRLTAQSVCRQAVREEAVEQLGDAQRSALQTASTAQPTSWRVAGR